MGYCGPCLFDAKTKKSIRWGELHSEIRSDTWREGCKHLYPRKLLWLFVWVVSICVDTCKPIWHLNVLHNLAGMQHSPLGPLTTRHMQMLQEMMHQAFCQRSMVTHVHGRTYTHLLTSSSNFRHQSFSTLFPFVYYMDIKVEMKMKSCHICIFWNLLTGSNQRRVQNWSLLDHSTWLKKQ